MKFFVLLILSFIGFSEVEQPQELQSFEQSQEIEKAVECCRLWYVLSREVQDNGVPQTSEQIQEFHSKVSEATNQTILIISSCGCSANSAQAIADIEAMDIPSSYKSFILDRLKSAIDSAQVLRQ